MRVNTRGGTVYAGSAVTSNAFAIATSNGTMTADVTVWLTGEAEMSLDTTYSVGKPLIQTRAMVVRIFSLV